MPRTVLDLPHETLINILHQISDVFPHSSERRSKLRYYIAFSLTCCTFFEVARPFVFKRVDMGSPQRGCELLALIELHPQISSSVEKLDLSPYLDPGDSLSSWFASADGATLVSLLPTVKKLIVESWGHKSSDAADGEATQDLVTQAWKNLFRLESITSLYIRSRPPPLPILLRILTGVAYPSLRVLRFTATWNGHDTWLPSVQSAILPRTTASPTIRKLVLGRWNDETLLVLLSRLRWLNLEELYLSLNKPKMWPSQWEYEQDLFDHAPRLRHLTIAGCDDRLRPLSLENNPDLECLEFDHMSNEEPWVARTLSTLSSATRLKHVRISGDLNRVQKKTWLGIDTALHGLYVAGKLGSGVRVKMEANYLAVSGRLWTFQFYHDELFRGIRKLDGFEVVWPKMRADRRGY